MGSLSSSYNAAKSGDSPNHKWAIADRLQYLRENGMVVGFETFLAS